MASDSRRVCRYYSRPGGCDRGSTCAYRHVDGPGEVLHPTQGSPRGYQRGGVPRGGAPRPPISRAPRGVCDFYYHRGFCARGAECRFLHESPAHAAHQSSGSSSIDGVSAFLTPAALARIQGAGTDGFFATPHAEMSPSEVNGHIRKFLEDSYRFRFAAEVYGFSALLSNASAGNSSWVRITLSVSPAPSDMFP